MSDPKSPFFERSMGFYSEHLRKVIMGCSVRIAGVGGGGLTLAVMLAKEGVREFSIADVDVVDATNVGRIPLLTVKHIGQSKVEVAAQLIVEHNPEARVRVYGNGITQANADEFVSARGWPNGPIIAFDEIDLYEPAAAWHLHRASRTANVPVISVTDVERGAFVTTFQPTSGLTFERSQGARPDDSLDEFLRKSGRRLLPTIPNAPKTGSIATLWSVGQGAPLPTTLRSVLVATDLAMDEFERVICESLPNYRRRPHVYPNVHCVNPSAGEDFTTKRPRFRSHFRVAKLIARDFLGLNPPTGYSKRSRREREEYRARRA